MSATPMLRSLSAPCARPHSPSPKKLSARDTPFGLFDPHGRHNHSPSVGVSSTLTIVRMPYAAGESSEVAGKDDRGGRRQLTQMHTRSHSSSSLLLRSSSPNSRTERFSFADNALVRAPQNSSRHNSLHARSASTPVASLRQARTQTKATQRFSPQQVYSSAQSARAPWTGKREMGDGDASSESFVPLPPDVLLPFASRASEVSDLFSQGANAKLLGLLSHILPSASDEASSSTPILPSSIPLASKLPEDWTFADLKFWLFQVDRTDVADALWVRTLRRAILTHSEVLWERVKAVLGAPFDLDAVTVSPSSFEGGRSALTLNLIHPVPKTVGGALHAVSEDENEGEITTYNHAEDKDAIVGLRLSTPRSHPVLSNVATACQKRSSSPSRSPRIALRSLSQNTVPTVSSPLAERHFDGRDIEMRMLRDRQPSSERPLKTAKKAPLFPGSLNFSGMRLALGA
ncbi:hypothetical protein SCHPADRAFT_941012 [Schizopora paradoxa]|uniref:Uncharacterized protein n=1 Tax=Schizopora paradoxa TaxID=27342 RepID=A0A0H2S7A7_9AGAM|nr:hypothetical protein SCHPADRAFT_941012 [Schizopora paradoxa]